MNSERSPQHARGRIKWRMPSWSLGLLLVALGAAAARLLNPAASWAEPAQQPAQGAVCGDPGLPSCPLQGWMRASVAKALAGNDLGSLAVGLERTARMVPDPAWKSWGSSALQGADAAKRGDLVAVRASCRGCHSEWRDAYRSKYRTRPLPR